MISRWNVEETEPCTESGTDISNGFVGSLSLPAVILPAGIFRYSQTIYVCFFIEGFGEQERN
jgi:hypothetical protein